MRFVGRSEDTTTRWDHYNIEYDDPDKCTLNISQNGFHDFFKVTKNNETYIFDNHNPTGIKLDDWTKRLFTPSGEQGRPFLNGKSIEKLIEKK